MLKHISSVCHPNTIYAPTHAPLCDSHVPRQNSELQTPLTDTAQYAHTSMHAQTYMHAHSTTQDTATDSFKTLIFTIN